jgi:outer membrane protein assembly factor BamB
MKKGLQAGCGLILLSLFTACSGRDIRPHFKSENDVLRREWSFSVEPLSSQMPIGGMEYVSPVLVDNALIFGSSRYGILSFYPKIKRLRWRLEIPNGVLSEIETFKDRAFFTGGDGKMYSISLESGKPLWSYDLRNPVSSRPRVAGDDLYVVTSDDAILSLEAKTGKWQWHYRRRNAAGPTIHGASQPLVVGDAVWVGFADGALVALSRKEGKVLWEKQLNANKRFSGLNAEFLEKDGLVYVPAYDHALYALNAKTGSPVWVREGLGGSKKVTIASGVLYAPSSQGKLYALDPKSGKELWSFDLDDGVPSGVVVTGDHVLFSSTHEYLYALDRKSGALEYRYQVGYSSGFSGGLAYDAGQRLLFALSRGGNLYSFRYLR